MTQFTQMKNGLGNTVLTHRGKRNWCFTLNNYNENDITQLHKEKSNISCKQFCFQEEKGKNEIPHLQGVIAYNNTKSLRTMRKLLPRAHWESCNNLKASLAYCSKEETRNGNTFTYNYEIIKIMTNEEWEEWKKKDLDHDISECIEDVIDMKIGI